MRMHSGVVAAAYLSPQDLPGYSSGIDIDPSLSNTTFADTAGTTPASINGNMQRIDDAKGLLAASYQQTSISFGSVKIRQDGLGQRYIDFPLTLAAESGQGFGSEYLNEQIGYTIDTSACTVYVVTEVLGRAQFSSFLAFGAGYRSLFGSNSDGSLLISNNGSQVLTSNPLPVNRVGYGRNVYAYANDAANNQMTFVGPYGTTIKTSITIPTGNLSSSRIFVNGGNNNNGIPAGKVYRILVYPTVHSPSQIAATVAGLQTKYNAPPSPPALSPTADLVVYASDSRSFGQATSIVNDLPNQSTPNGVQWVNLSVGGSGSASILARLSEIQSYYSASRSHNVIVFYLGINAAYGLSDLATLFSLSDTLRASGWKVVLCSETANNGTADTARQTWLHDSTGFYAHYSAHSDGMADFAANANIGAYNSDPMSLRADNLHFNTYAVHGTVLKPVLTTVLAS